MVFFNFFPPRKKILQGGSSAPLPLRYSVHSQDFSNPGACSELRLWGNPERQRGWGWTRSGSRSGVPGLRTPSGAATPLRRGLRRGEASSLPFLGAGVPSGALGKGSSEASKWPHVKKAWASVKARPGGGRRNKKAALSLWEEIILCPANSDQFTHRLHINQKMELKLTRIWSLNHYSNPGATAGQMPKGRLVPRCWGGARRSIGIGDRGHRRPLSPGPGVRPLHRDLSRSRSTCSSTQLPTDAGPGGRRRRGEEGLRAASWPRHTGQDGVRDTGWTRRAEEQQQVLSFQCHQRLEGGMPLQLGRSCTNSKVGGEYKGGKKKVLGLWAWVWR